jgi:acyl-coenzyme A thioesterase PaaI-like protein
MKQRAALGLARDGTHDAEDPDGLPAGAGGRAFAEFLGLRRDGPGLTSLTVHPGLLNGAGLLLGPVGFALVDYSMASALWMHRNEGESIATINISLNFLQSATEGIIECRSTLDRRNRYAAALSSQVRHADGRLLITAVGSFAIRADPTASG